MQLIPSNGFGFFQAYLKRKPMLINYILVIFLYPNVSFCETVPVWRSSLAVFL